MSSFAQRVASFAKLFNGAPDALPSTRSIFKFDGSRRSAAQYTATVHTDKEWGGRSRATFRVGVGGPSGSGVCGIFEGFIDRRPSDIEVEGVSGRRGFAMLQLQRSDDDITDCEDFDALEFRANSDGRLYALSLRNSVPLAPNLAYQGYLVADGTKGWQTFELPFTSFVATRGGRLLGTPRILDVARFGSMSIAVADDIDGPFRIEIEAIEATREPGQV